MKLSESCYEATKLYSKEKKKIFFKERQDTRTTAPVGEHLRKSKEKSANILTDELFPLLTDKDLGHILESPCGHANVQTLTKYVLYY